MSQRSLLNDFHRWGYDEKGWTYQTRRTYYDRVVRANAWLNEHRGVSILWAKPKDLKAYLWSCPPDARTRNGIRSAILAFGGYLEASGLVEANPAAALPRIPEKRDLPKALTEEQAKRILIVCKTRPLFARVLMSTLVFTGMRHAEVRTLRWGMVDLDDGWLRFTGKGSKERVIPIHDELWPLLRLWRKENPSDYVFPSPRRQDRPVSSTGLHELVRDIGTTAGIAKLYPHLLRHTCATLLLEAGNDLRTIQEWLGHVNPQTTAIYTRIRPTNLREAAKKWRITRNGTDAS